MVDVSSFSGSGIGGSIAGVIDTIKRLFFQLLLWGYKVLKGIPDWAKLSGIIILVIVSVFIIFWAWKKREAYLHVKY